MMQAIVGRGLELAGRCVDRRLGLETSGQVAVSELGYDPDRHGCYEPSRWSLLRGALPRNKVSEDDVFADIGSGKGRVIIEAARLYPFRRVIGVELSPELIAVAADNLRRLRRPLRCRNIDLVHADASAWVPPDDLTIAYMFNPVRGAVFSAVISHLIDLVDRRDRPLPLIYVNPLEHDRLVQTGRVRQISAPAGLRYRLLRIPRDWVRVYEIAPQG
jgi:SAM-dependent methyltransferase